MSGNRRRIAGAVGLLVLIAAVATLAHDERNHVTVAPAHRVDAAGPLAHTPAELDGGKVTGAAADHRTRIDRSGRLPSDRRGRRRHPARRRIAPSRPTGTVTHGRPRPARHPRRPATPKPKPKPKPVADRTPIVVAAVYSDKADIERTYAQYGGSAGAVDAGPAARAVVDSINAAGGVGGHPLQLRTIPIVTGRRSYDEIDASVCAELGQSPRPVAVVGRQGPLPKCAAAGGSVYIVGSTVAEDSDFMAGHARSYFNPAGPAVDRVPSFLVPELQTAGFFDGNQRVGLVWSQVAGSRTGARATEAALQQAGVAVVAKKELMEPRSVTDAALTIAQMTTAALQFHAKKVTRMILVDAGGVFTEFFMRAADAQKFTPQWALTTQNGPAELARTAPLRQLRGAVGVGWQPVVDVLGAEEGAASARAQECDAIFARAGVDPGIRGVNGQGVTYTVCDGLLLLREALRTSTTFTPAAVGDAIAALGSRYTSALSFATDFSARNDGLAGYRRLRFDAGCRCFAYDGPVLRTG
jgi:ABC-type branched-subunit amino acid transport system substrate-binding protein